MYTYYASKKRCYNDPKDGLVSNGEMDMHNTDVNVGGILRIRDTFNLRSTSPE